MNVLVRDEYLEGASRGGGACLRDELLEETFLLSSAFDLPKHNIIKISVYIIVVNTYAGSTALELCSFIIAKLCFIKLPRAMKSPDGAVEAKKQNYHESN